MLSCPTKAACSTVLACSDVDTALLFDRRCFPEFRPENPFDNECLNIIPHGTCVDIFTSKPEQTESEDYNNDFKSIYQ